MIFSKEITKIYSKFKKTFITSSLEDIHFWLSNHYYVKGNIYTIKEAYANLILIAWHDNKFYNSDLVDRENRLKMITESYHSNFLLTQVDEERETFDEFTKIIDRFFLCVRNNDSYAVDEIIKSFTEAFDKEFPNEFLLAALKPCQDTNLLKKLTIYSCKNPNIERDLSDYQGGNFDDTKILNCFRSCFLSELYENAEIILDVISDEQKDILKYNETTKNLGSICAIDPSELTPEGYYGMNTPQERITYFANSGMDSFPNKNIKIKEKRVTFADELGERLCSYSENVVSEDVVDEFGRY